jgi:hypothetical protein
MTYRRLTNEELAPLEQKFIQFLVSNTITGDDWKQMKERRPEQAMGLIDIFSDIIFEETLKKVSFLKQATPKELHIFHFKEDKIELIGLVANVDSPIDFIKDDSWLKNLQNTEGGVSFFQNEKKYTEQREIELFKMLENGCRITDNYLFDALKKLGNW